MDNLILVNKENALFRNYIPDDLVICDNNENNFHDYLDPNLKPMIRREAYINFLKLREDALKQGYNIIVDSGYRSYEYQDAVWRDNYFKNYYEIQKERPNIKKDDLVTLATDLTNEYTALPGHSEHQTGLAFDFAVMRDGKYSEEALDEEIKWMEDNAYKYGFILRYPKGKEGITGFNHEYWHYRYIGLPYSEECYLNNYTLEEYHRLILKK